jgi:uncharacterized membrane-anchored protein YjiN (DUF445 family)
MLKTIEELDANNKIDSTTDYVVLRMYDAEGKLIKNKFVDTTTLSNSLEIANFAGMLRDWTWQEQQRDYNWEVLTPREYKEEFLDKD